MKMKQLKQILTGLAAVAGIFGTSNVGVAQDWSTHGATSQRVGHNGASPVFNPGRGFLRWFRPNITDNVGGTVVVDNEDGPPSMTFTPGWTFPTTRDREAFFAYQPDPNSPAPYHYTTTVASNTNGNPTQALPPLIARTASWTFSSLGVSPRNYALYVWLPAGSTLDNSVARNQLFPQRFFVYEITYGTGQTWIDVVDTSVAGQGWVRLGAGGRTTNQLFPYDGTTPIRIRLFNTVPRDGNGNLSDNPNTTVVYADAAMAVPEIGFYTASPIVSQLTGGLVTTTFGALNEKTVAIREGQPATIEQGVVTAWVHDTGQRRWVFNPALEDPNLTFNQDNNSAGVTFAPPWTAQTTGANFKGTNFLNSTVVGTLLASTNVIYDPGTAITDGSYDIYVWLPGDSGLRSFAQALTYEIREGLAVTTVTVDQSQNRGWVRLGTRRFNHSEALGNPLTVAVTNFSADPLDLTREAFTDAIRFVGTTNLAVNSTPVFANARVNIAGSGVVDRDVVVVAGENGRLYCLDATGRGDGTTDVLWTYPSTPDPTDAGWTDPNQVVGEDGPGGIAQMPTSGFDLSSALIERIGGEDFLYIAARNGRVYSIEMVGRGDMDFNLRKPGTTRRIWSFPNDYPAVSIPSNLGAFTGSLSFADTTAGPTIFAPASQGRMYALSATAGPNKTTAIRWQFPLATQPTLGSIQTSPVIQVTGAGTGNVIFGTAANENLPEPVGELYSLNINTGAVNWRFDGSPASGSARLADSFLSTPAYVDAATIGGGMPDTVFVANENRFVYALNAATGNVIWQTDELNTGVRAPLTYTPMTVLANDTVSLLPFPLVLVPTADGRVSGLFARGTDVNRFNGKLAKEFTVAGDSITASASSGRSWLYVADSAGYLYAFDDDPSGLIPGQGTPPPGFGETIPPNDASGDVFRNAKITFIKKSFYQRLRLRDVPAADPALPTYAEVSVPANIENRNAFEWGETLYILVYDFPYQVLDTGGNTVEPPIINFQLSVEGQSVRNVSQRAKLFRASSPNTPNSGYAILAFPLQGGGANAMPPGSGVITFDLTTTALNSSGRQDRITMNRLTQRKEFRVANPIGFRVFDLVGGFQDYAVTNDPSNAQALTNGNPDDPLTNLIREDRLTSPFGFLSHGQAGKSRVLIYDRSMMTVLRGPGRGLENVRYQRRDQEWQGGPGAVFKPIDPLLFPLFEELPVNFPNTSPDYPNIPREYIKITKDPDNAPENPLYGPVSLIPPTLPGGGQVTEDDVLLRLLRPTPFEYEMAVPRYQPANATTLPNSIGTQVPAGYYGRLNVFVDSSGNGVLDRINGRREAFRAHFLANGVTRDERIVVTTPNLDLGSLGPGTGFDPTLPGSGGSTFAPWPNTNANPFAVLFKEIGVQNEGNVNLLNVRLAKATETGGVTTPWAIPAGTNHELAWLDSEYHVWSDFDYPAGFSLTNPVLIQKPRVGDRIGTAFTTNPIRRDNPNTGAIQSALLPSPDPANPRIGVTIPPGMPVGTYSERMRLIEDGWTWNGTNYVFNPADADAALKLAANGQALEAFSDPTFTLSFKVREGRLTTSYTNRTYPFIDNLIPGGSSPSFFHKNLGATGTRTPLGDVVMAYASNQASFNLALPTEASLNDRFRIFLATMDGQATSGNQARSPLEPLNYFDRTSGTPRFFSQEVGPYPVPANPSQGQLAPLFLPGAGETVLEDTVKFGSPVFPALGIRAPLSDLSQRIMYMAFVGDAQIQTPAGRNGVSHLYLSSIDIQSNGSISVGPPTVMTADPNVSKSRPALVQNLGDAYLFYGTAGTGRGQLFRVHYNSSQWNAPQQVALGDGFESITNPAAFPRRQLGTGLPLSNQPVIEITFVGKLKTRPNSEIFYGRVSMSPNGQASTTPALMPAIRDRLVGEPGGLYNTQGLLWDPRQPIVLEQTLGGVTTDLEVPGTRRRDDSTGLISFDTTLGGKAYLDPSVGSVRFGSAAPSSAAVIHLTYSPRILRVSGGRVAGHGSPSVLVDNRRVGSISYWARPDNTGAQAGDDIRATRFIFTYTRAASGEGMTTRPYMRTARLGAQLDYPIYTNPDGTIPPGGLTVTGATSFYQVDPANGRVYFTDADEGRNVTIQYTGVDEGTGQPFNAGSANYRIGLISEKAEAPVPIEQAVNETQLWTTLDGWEAPNTQMNPGLIWMFWSSTRGGTPDIFFQTIAPKFTPVARRGG